MINLKYTAADGVFSWWSVDGNNRSNLGRAGFELRVGDITYQLLAPFKEPANKENLDVLLIRRDQDTVKLLGKARLNSDRMAEWAEKLINQNLPKSRNFDLFSPIVPEPGTRTDSTGRTILGRIEQLAANGLPTDVSYLQYLEEIFHELSDNRYERDATLSFLLHQDRLKVASKTIQEAGGPSYYEAIEIASSDNFFDSDGFFDEADLIDSRWED